MVYKTDIIWLNLNADKCFGKVRVSLCLVFQNGGGQLYDGKKFYQALIFILT